MKTTRTFSSSAHVHVRYHLYQPKVVLRTKAVVQIFHGRGEHADLYDHFAKFLAANGYAVVVSDWVGHGMSLIDFEQGYFGASNGIKNMMKDVVHLHGIVRRTYPEEPYFLLGFDFGATMVHKFISDHGLLVDGAISIGPLVQVKDHWVKKKFFDVVRLIKGPTYKAKYYYQILHKRKKEDVVQQFLTSDEELMKKIDNDPMTNFAYTTQGLRDILSVIKEINNESSIKKIEKRLPLLIAVGDEDTASIGIDEFVSKYEKQQMDDFTFVKYEHCKHGLLYEKNRLDIYNDFLHWFNERTYL